MTAEPKPSMKTFRVTLRAGRGTDDATAIRGLRSILKIAWRRFQLRAIDVREIRDRASPDEAAE
jgi:hypothetical protein